MTEIALLGGPADSREVLRTLLRLHRFPVKADGKGLKDAKRMLQEGFSGILLADTDLSDGSWEEVLEAVQGSKSKPRVVLLSPFYGPDFEAKARRLGAHAVVLRPFEIPELLEALRSASSG